LHSHLRNSTVEVSVAANDQLQRLEAFSRLSPSGKKILSQGLTIATCPQSTAVLHKGQPVSGAYLVLDGRLRVFTIAPNGTEATLYFIAPGETCVLALNCLFSDLLYPAWVQAESTATVAVIPGAVYRNCSIPNRRYEISPCTHCPRWCIG
jgi:CRP/FNR family transcriptional regulator, anaerobic regulatory protein